MECIGIGRAAAYALAQHGARGLALVDINTAMLDGTRVELQTRYPKLDVLVMSIDVTDEESVDTAAKKTAEQFGRIDIAINCAGISGNPTPTTEMGLKDWQKVIDVNQTGVWLCQRAMIRQMLTQE